MPPFTRCLISVCLIGILSAPAASADDLFEPPIRLKADGKVIDTGSPVGHCGPCVEDLDGDGLKDLLVGDFGGDFEIFRNVGTAEEPKFEQNGFLQAGGEPAKVRIYCCVAAQPRFCDLDGDGIRDMISSSYDPGHCYFFRGLPGHKFAAREELLDRSGVPVRGCPMQKDEVQSFGSFFTSVDWDADGDLDLLIGCFDGTLKLRINEGDAKHYRFATENQTIKIKDEPLKVDAHFCPLVADWDGDGLWDILSGSEEGSVTWFRNTGKTGKPGFEPGQVLVSPYDIDSGYARLVIDNNDVVPAGRVQIDVTDFNNDGKLDLIVGDYNISYDLKAGLSDEEKQKAKQLVADYMKAARALRTKVIATKAEFDEKYPGEEAFSDEAAAIWEQSYQKLQDSPEWKREEAAEVPFAKQMRQYLAKSSGPGNNSFEVAMHHGYVWLFQRK